MTIPVRYERNGDYWRLTYYDRTGKRQRRGGGAIAKVSEREIRAECFRLAAELGTNALPLGPREIPTLRQWIDIYAEQRTDLGHRTLAMHENTGAYMLERIGDIRIDKITRHQAADWRAWLVKDKGLTEQTACAHSRNAKVIFGRAVEQDIVPFSPFDRLRGTAPAVEDEFQQLTKDQLRQLIDRTGDTGWKRLFGLCGWAGLRHGEALRVRWGDVQANKLRVSHAGTVTNKLKGRVVKLEPELANLLGTPGEDDDLVVSLGSPDWFRAARRLIVAAGLKPWRKPFHTLRKNRATWWRDEYPEHVVDAWMGHSLEVARRHYAAVPESAYLPQPSPKTSQV